MLRRVRKWLPKFRNVVMPFPSWSGSLRRVSLQSHATEEQDYSETVTKGEGFSGEAYPLFFQ